MKKFRIHYKKGHTQDFLGYSLEHHGNKYYVCGIAYVGDGPSWYTINDAAIDYIEEV